MKTIITTALILVFSIQTMGQQEPLVSQYMFNGLFINPGYAGSHKYFESTLLFRKQWVNFNGAPENIIAAIDGPIYKDKMGIGLVISNDNIGVTNQTDIVANYAYKLKLGEGTMAFGIKAGISQYRANFGSDDFKVWDKTDDPIYATNINGVTIPRFGTGIYYHQERWYAGVSIPTLLAYDNDYQFSVNINNASELRRHLYINGGYVFDLNDSWKAKPSVLVKYTGAAPLQVDINTNFLYKEILWLGASFRSGDSFTGLIEYQANERFRIGYAHDFTITQIRNYSAGTHEIMIGFDFGKDFAKVKTPRYF